jgi:formate hydrogenlyase subunit 7
MSRWVGIGLSSGVKTTSFPKRDDPAASSAASTIQLDASRLTPELALAAAGACPTDAITVEGDATEGKLLFDAGQCILCGRCVRKAPQAFVYRQDPRVAVRRRRSLQEAVGWKEGRIGSVDAARPSEDLAAETAELQTRAHRIFGRSLHLRHVDAGSCNACESELQLLTSPHYDLARLGVFFTPTPRHADGLLVTGVVTRQMHQALLDTHQAMAEPKMVIAAGVCAIGGGCFAGGPTVHGPLDLILPVDVYIPGCPPSPAALIHGLLLATARAEERHRARGSGRGA